MASQAERLRRKRAAQGAGRPRKEGVERYPSGKIKPVETEREAMSVALEARERIHGLKENNALAGYTLGRIHLDGNISKELLDVGNEYGLAMARYYNLVGIPFPSARAQSLFSIKGHDGDVTDTFAKRARAASNRMMEMQGILLRCVDGPQVKTTVHNCVVMDIEELRLMGTQQLLWLKRGLLALRDSGILPNHNKSATDITRYEVSASA